MWWHRTEELTQTKNYWDMVIKFVIIIPIKEEGKQVGVVADRITSNDEVVGGGVEC